MVIKNRHRVYKAVYEPPAFFQLGHVQGTKTANPINNVLTGQHGVFHFLLDDLRFNILFSVLQLVKPLFGGNVYNPHLDSVQHIRDTPLRFLQLGREYAAFPALNIHHSIGYVLHEIVIHHPCHDSADNSVFNGGFSYALVFGVAGSVLFGVHTAVIVILFLGGAGAALAHHHSPAGAAKQLGCQQIIILGLMTGGGFPILCQLLLHPVKQVLRYDGWNTIRNDDFPVFIFTQEFSVVEDRRHKVKVYRSASHSGHACIVEIVPYFLHRRAVVIAGENFQHDGGGARVDLIVHIAVDGIAESGGASVVLTLQSVLRMPTDHLLRQLGGVVFCHPFQHGFQDDALRPLGNVLRGG